MRDFDPPIVINCRDRLTPLKALVEWLERAGHEHIVLLDNASTYEPLLEYLAESPHMVLRATVNYGSRALWHPSFDADRSDWFVYTDPDIVPLEDCPANAVDVLRGALEAFPQFPKAGLGLYLEDVPADMPSLEWERSLTAPERELTAMPGAYASLIDTTFALYRPGSEFAFEAIRLGWPYQARHDSAAWYGGELSDEDRYYLARADGADRHGSSWKDVAHV